MSKIKAPDLSPMTNNQFWQMRYEMDIKRPALPPRHEVCSDCAVTTGFYAEFTHELARQTDQKIRKVCSNRWFCHNDLDKACRGNIDLMEMIRGVGDG